MSKKSTGQARMGQRIDGVSPQVWRVLLINAKVLEKSTFCPPPSVVGARCRGRPTTAIIAAPQESSERQAGVG